MNDNDRATRLATHLAQAWSHRPNVRRGSGLDGSGSWSGVTSRLTDDTHIARAVQIELSKLLPQDPLQPTAAHDNPATK